MRTAALPPLAVVLSFIDYINRADLDGLERLMTDDHSLRVLDEPPLQGRSANVDAWRGYTTSFPKYVIYPDRLSEEGDRVAVLGRTTGSHLGLPDDEERKLTVIWFAEVRGEKVALWQILADTPERRAELRLD